MKALLARAAHAARMPLAAILLGVACVTWAAVPSAGQGFAAFLTVVGAVCVGGGALRLTLGWIPLPEDAFLVTGTVRGWIAFLRFLRVPPWEEVAVAALVWLEVLHRSRPWHTAVLGLVLVAYLLAVHLAESRSAVSALRPQALAVSSGVILLAAGAGFGMLHALSPGAGSAWLRVVAAVAVVCAAGLVLPSVQAGGPDPL